MKQTLLLFVLAFLFTGCANKTKSAPEVASEDSILAEVLNDSAADNSGEED